MFDKQGFEQDNDELQQLLEQVLESLQLLRDRFSALISESESRVGKADLQVAELRAIFEGLNRVDSALQDLPSIDDATEHLMSLINTLVSGGQFTPTTCSLPFHQNPPHLIYRGGRVCQKDPRHVFCNKHNLSNCIICGGNLK